MIFCFFHIFLDRETQFKDEDVHSLDVNNVVKIKRLTDLIPDLEFFQPTFKT
jgi:hypothetical protein